MFAITKIKDDSLEVCLDKKILRKEDYLAYVESVEIINRANSEAKSIRDNLAEERKKSHEEGYQQGLDESQKKCSYQIQKTLAACNEYYLSIENELIVIVMEILNKIFDSFTEVEVTQKVIKSVLNLVCNEKKVVLYVNENQVNDIRKSVTTLLEDYPNIHYIDVLPDARVQVGGAILETDVGIIDANLNTQLLSLETALKDNIGNHLELSNFDLEKKKVTIASQEDKDQAMAYKASEEALTEKIRNVRNKKVKVHFSTQA